MVVVVFIFAFVVVGIGTKSLCEFDWASGSCTKKVRQWQKCASSAHKYRTRHTWVWIAKTTTATTTTKTTETTCSSSSSSSRPVAKAMFVQRARGAHTPFFSTLLLSLSSFLLLMSLWNVTGRLWAIQPPYAACHWQHARRRPVLLQSPLFVLVFVTTRLESCSVSRTGCSPLMHPPPVITSDGSPSCTVLCAHHTHMDTTTTTNHTLHLHVPVLRLLGLLLEHVKTLTYGWTIHCHHGKNMLPERSSPANCLVAQDDNLAMTGH